MGMTLGLAPMAERTAANNALNTDLSKADLLRGTHFADAPRS